MLYLPSLIKLVNIALTGINTLSPGSVVNLLDDLEKITLSLQVFLSIIPPLQDFSLMNRDNAYEQM